MLAEGRTAIDGLSGADHVRASVGLASAWWTLNRKNPASKAAGEPDSRLNRSLVRAMKRLPSRPRRFSQQ